MKQLRLLILLLLYSAVLNAKGGCGSSIEIKNPTPLTKIITSSRDTIRMVLNPADSTIIFALYIFEGNCDIVNAHWFKNGSAIKDDWLCQSAGKGIYRVTYQTDAPFITNYDITIIVTDQPTGIHEPTKLALDFNLFPNPSVSGLFTIEREVAEPCIVRIYDFRGHIVKEQKIVNTRDLVDISMLYKGMYVLELAAANGLQRRKKIVFD